MSTAHALSPAPSREYEAFPNVEARNGLQERIEIPLMLRALGLEKGGRILEVGCGRGIALRVFAERLTPRALVGVDVDPVLVALAEERVRRGGIAARVIHGDVRALPLPAESFDLVVDFGTCYQVTGGEEGAVAALCEIGRVLRPGGALGRPPEAERRALTDLSPPLLCAVALVVAAAGGLLPFTPVEPMLVAIAAVTRPSLLVVVIVVATVGQMASKWVLYAGSCRAADALRPGRRVAVDKAMARLSGTRRRQLLTVFLSAAAGLPPFYVVTVAWGVARLCLTDFVIAGTIGRAARFTVIMLPPNLYL
jgi:SAM-dependent methyltransferase